jgi:hypothetical protein
VSEQVNNTQPAAALRSSWSARRPMQAAALYAFAYLLLAGGGALLASLVSSPPLIVALVTAVATATLVLSLLLVLSISRLHLRLPVEFAAMLVMMTAFALVRPSVFSILGRWLGWRETGERLAALLPSLPGQELLGNVLLVLWAAFLGRLVSRIIREGKLLLPVALVASLGDTITVFWGVVAHVTENAPEVAQTFSASAPLAPPPDLPAPILSAIGIGDFLFLALFLAVLIRCSMQPVKTLWATFAVTLAVPFLFLLWPQAPGLPGLPFISAAVLWANWRHLEFTKEEKRALAFAGALVAVVALAIWVTLQR